MKSLLFKQQIWQGKSKALATYGEAVTRRLITPQPETVSGDALGQSYIYFNGNPNPVKLPFQSGEIVYLREAFAVDDNGIPVYRSNYGTTEDDTFPPSTFKWQSPYAMSEALARTFLRIKDVRPERLQEITEADVDEEGIRRVLGDGGIPGPGCKWDGWGYEGTTKNLFHTARHNLCDCNCRTNLTPAVCSYRELWDSINKKTPWSSNPWVWRIEFEQAERPGL